VSRIKNICDEFKKLEGICLFPGVELTHVPPSLIPDLVERSRRLGAKVVIVHGETIVEPVEPGTNCAALLSDIDILAHPGLITEQEMKIANQRGICLEITSRKGHSLTNGHVASLAKAVGAKLVLNTDTHIPEDIITKDLAIKIIQSCGLEREDFEYMMKNALQILDKRDLKV
jgi:histidinol phosphatase-like PHP family hydrolase